MVLSVGTSISANLCHCRQKGYIVTSRLKDYHLSPPKLFAVKNIFYCFIKFLSHNIIVFVGVILFVNIH